MTQAPAVGSIAGASWRAHGLTATRAVSIGPSSRRAPDAARNSSVGLARALPVVVVVEDSTPPGTTRSYRWSSSRRVDGTSRSDSRSPPCRLPRRRGRRWPRCSSVRARLASSSSPARPLRRSSVVGGGIPSKVSEQVQRAVTHPPVQQGARDRLHAPTAPHTALDHLPRDLLIRHVPRRDDQREDPANEVIVRGLMPSSWPARAVVELDAVVARLRLRRRWWRGRRGDRPARGARYPRCPEPRVSCPCTNYGVRDARRMAPDTIVLIHGFWVTPRSWEQWISPLRGQGLPGPRPGLSRVRGRGRGAQRRPDTDRGPDRARRHRPPQR